MNSKERNWSGRDAIGADLSRKEKSSSGHELK